MAASHVVRIPWRRGVSPLWATILLVVITAGLAALLYVLLAIYVK